MKSSFTSHSPKETKDFARDFAKQILLDYKSQNLAKKDALVLGLEGELGAGKTTFVQGFAQGLGIKDRALSPTFVIMKSYSIQNANPRMTANVQMTYSRHSNGICRFALFYHIDCYRLHKPAELLALGFKKIVSNPSNIVIIEWADRVKKILPRTALHISFEHARPGQRKITLDLIS